MKTVTLSFTCPVTPGCDGKVELEVEHATRREPDEPVDWSVNATTDCSKCGCVPEIEELNNLESLDMAVFEYVSANPADVLNDFPDD